MFKTYSDALDAMIEANMDEIQETNDLREEQGLSTMGAIDWLEFFRSAELEEIRARY